MTQNADTIHEVVQERYGAIACSGGEQDACCGPADSGAGCGSLYGTEMLEGLPLDVTGLSLGCGESQFA
jgi:hypothetical protein